MAHEHCSIDASLAAVACISGALEALEPPDRPNVIAAALALVDEQDLANAVLEAAKRRA